MERMVALGEETRIGMGDQARRRVTSSYTISAVVTKWKNIYDQFLLREPEERIGNQFGKRAVDALAAGVLLALTGPFLAAVGAGVRLSSPGPGIYRQPRLGRGGKPFLVCKFRSMYRGAPEIRNTDGSAFNAA